MISRLRALLCLVPLLAAATACKTGGSGADVKDESDVIIKEAEPGDRFFITCRDGRLQNGQKSTHVTKEELKHVCEEVDPATTLPAGSGSAASLSQCINLAENIKTLNVGFTAAFTEQASHLDPFAATQQLCESMLPILKNTLDRDPGLFRFLNGTTTGAHTAIVFDTANAAVRFDPDFNSINVPLKVVPAVAAKINAEIDLKLCRAGGADGHFVGGSCWYLSKSGVDCDVTCANVNMGYSDETKTFAGSAGTLLNCSNVGIAFRNLAGRDARCPAKLNGCVQDSSRLVLRCTTPETQAIDNMPAFRRYCACK